MAVKQTINMDGEIINTTVEILDNNDKFFGQAIQDISQPTELGESLKELNNDDLATNRVSNIDMRSRLHPIEVPSILAVDTLVAFKLLPISCLGFTRQKKRLSVSIEGKGRQEIVDIVAGKREQDVKGGSTLMDKLPFMGNRKEGGNSNGLTN